MVNRASEAKWSLPAGLACFIRTKTLGIEIFRDNVLFCSLNFATIATVPAKFRAQKFYKTTERDFKIDWYVPLRSGDSVTI